MGKIQWFRKGTQMLFFGLTVAAILADFPIYKGLILMTTITGGVFFCGWACPFGFLQDIGSKIGRTLGIKKRSLPESVHKVAVYFRYFLAIVSLALMTDMLMTLFSIEPRSAFTAFITGRVPSNAAMITVIIFFILSIKYDRIYCRYFCAEGARYGLVSLVRPVTIRRNEAVCAACGKCDRACPMQINVSKVGNLRSPQCVNCFECVSACPVKGALEYGIVQIKTPAK